VAFLYDYLLKLVLWLKYKCMTGTNVKVQILTPDTRPCRDTGLSPLC